ncbi:metal-sensitive transcriptional regulator [Consotaella salsifontis]|uniref:DNA-binding transcriptional regulator, FrmR family n=1 Tax=Consotaella salsifontis TaxID=1365950 RepID=A0A1T4RN68_9HYPH|nr:metal-sensitive transcriptional regulator [Consotaella salsifontis]SKA17121.1 DNA-binding transcriptional regulator, FrmR family [Consotaella salsifontis]
MHSEENRAAAMKRLKRIEGQVRGVIKMIEESRDCADVLDQSLAVRRALQSFEALLLADHSLHRMGVAARTGDAEDQKKALNEIIALAMKARP